MPFDDLPVIFQCYERIPLNKLNSTDSAVILAIATQKYGARVGLKRLASQARTSQPNCLKVLRKLRRLGIVRTENGFAHKNNQQHYTFNLDALRNMADTYSVSVKTPIGNKGSDIDVKGFFTDAKGSPEATDGYPERYPYREYKQYKNDKDERFSFITKDLPKEVRALIKYGNNIKEKLDNLERLGISLEAIKGALEETDFSNAEKVGGLFVSVLQRLQAKLKPTTEKTIEHYEPRECDLCTIGCAAGNDQESFNSGSRCYLGTAIEYRVTRERNGL